MYEKQQTKMTPWQRLEQVIKWSGLSTNKFALFVGLKRSENLYQIKRGAFGISKELATVVSTRYPQINRSWLLTGDGQMLAGMSSFGIDPDTIIPFYNVDATQLGIIDPEKHKPLYNISVPVAADFAAQCVGQSMAPDIPNGAVVVLKRAELDNFLPGAAYLVVTREFTTIKILRNVASDSSKLLLQPRNTVDFDEMMIERSKVKKLYAIKAVLTMFS